MTTNAEYEQFQKLAQSETRTLRKLTRSLRIASIQQCWAHVLNDSVIDQNPHATRQEIHYLVHKLSRHQMKTHVKARKKNRSAARDAKMSDRT